MLIVQILKEAINKGASDVILSGDSKPSLKINGDVTLLEEYEVMTPGNLNKEILSIMNEGQIEIFKVRKDLDFGIDLKGYGRFRVNVFSEKKGFAIVFRPIKSKLPSLDELGLPKKIIDFTKVKNGLVLITGTVGSGKSTTMSTMVEIINQFLPKHIITVEDPIEYVFENKKSLIEQREVGINTLSFESGLKYALRQASDVIMIGEMRDLETFRLALRAAETGNLVFATLHTAGAARTISRIIDMFPAGEKDQIKSQLSESLVGIIWQELIKNKNGDGRVLASEILVNNSSVSNMIRKGLTHLIPGAMETGGSDGMTTMVKTLEKLREEGLID